MDNEILSLCIPTRNRAEWLAIALNRINEEVLQYRIGAESLKVYISDNASTDNTQQVVQRFQSGFCLSYSRNEINIGADRNIWRCPGLARGKYVWIMGDDDSVLPGSLPYILDILQKHRLALFLNLGDLSTSGFKLPAHFKNFREFARECTRVNPHPLLAHSLISANIFRSDFFDLQVAEFRIKSNYGHMYAMVDRMTDDAGGVYVADRATIKVRNSSTDPVDGAIWPTHLEMENSWRDYLGWLKEKFDLKDLDPGKVNTYTRLAVYNEFKSHPIRILLHYGAFLRYKKTYKTLWRLIIG